MAITEAAITHQTLFIDGQWTPARDGDTVEVVNPFDEQLICTVACAGASDVDAAVSAARNAFDRPGGWSAWPPEERAAALDRLAGLLSSHADRIARTVTRQNGMPISLATALEAGFPAMLLRYYAELVRDGSNVVTRPGLLGGKLEIHGMPVGVVGAIVPWNYPQTLAAMKYAPALAAGCTVILKAALETPLDAAILAECASEAGIPPGVLSIMPGGAEVGRRLVSHPGVDKVAFTGSTAVGKEIASVCGSMLRPVTLELGGKSAGIVLEDADLVESSQQLFGAMFLNNGQTCFASSRILAPRNRYDEIVEFLAELADNAVIGDPLDANTAIGPLVNAKQRARVEAYVELGKDEGARVVAGGSRPSRPGFFVSPTVFANVDNSQRIAREEIFGPVVTVIAYDDEDEAVRIANDSPYGLGGTVWSADPEHAAAIARRIYTGTIGINGYTPDPGGPFGGMKHSGLGREFSTEGLANYYQLQTIYR